jgi:hypothetical protein
MQRIPKWAKTTVTSERSDESDKQNQVFENGME